MTTYIHGEEGVHRQRIIAAAKITAVIGSGTNARCWPDAAKEGSALPYIVLTDDQGGEPSLRSHGRIDWHANHRDECVVLCRPCRQGCALAGWSSFSVSDSVEPLAIALCMTLSSATSTTAKIARACIGTQSGYWSRVVCALGAYRADLDQRRRLSGVTSESLAAVWFAFTIEESERWQ